MAKVIRVGLIGLSAEGRPWAASAHLPYLANSSKYRIVALQNSSTEKAQKAIAHYKLPGDVKAYGTPEELSNDPDVDLVVSSVRVDSHASSVIPSIRAGKDVYVEWPLEANLTKAKELFELSQQHKVRTIIGLQGSFTPALHQLKQIITSGRIGRVLSSTYLNTLGRPGGVTPKRMAFFTDREIGGNMFTIFFGHTIEFIEAVLGPIKSSKSLISIQKPTTDLVDDDGTVHEKGHKQTAPDHIDFLGTFESGANLSLELRSTPAFPGLPKLDWRIQGTTGEIRVTFNGMAISVGDSDLKIEIADYESGEVENVAVEKLLSNSDIPSLTEPAANVAKAYDAFWEQKHNGGEAKYRDFEHAIRRMELIDGMYKQFDAEQAGK